MANPVQRQNDLLWGKVPCTDFGTEHCGPVESNNPIIKMGNITNCAAVILRQGSCWFGAHVSPNQMTNRETWMPSRPLFGWIFPPGVKEYDNYEDVLFSENIEKIAIPIKWGKEEEKQRMLNAIKKVAGYEWDELTKDQNALLIQILNEKYPSHCKVNSLCLFSAAVSNEVNEVKVQSEEDCGIFDFYLEKPINSNVFLDCKNPERMLMYYVDAKNRQYKSVPVTDSEISNKINELKKGPQKELRDFVVFELLGENYRGKVINPNEFSQIHIVQDDRMTYHRFDEEALKTRMLDMGLIRDKQYNIQRIELSQYRKPFDKGPVIINNYDVYYDIVNMALFSLYDYSSPKMKVVLKIENPLEDSKEKKVDVFNLEPMPDERSQETENQSECLIS